MRLHVGDITCMTPYPHAICPAPCANISLHIDRHLVLEISLQQTHDLWTTQARALLVIETGDTVRSRRYTVNSYTTDIGARAILPDDVVCTAETLTASVCC